ncbi:hypothetical protein G9F71_008985 [Clostridium sp. FP2]|uniref:hypothetical protein n=1 Tax=Clostridium sp. FP2 TaxID=2724481 RepID=UPI0013E99A37|nr:hypothetical protein [Clostridium sp. FP2]MBZ9622989.1 hypothetical protein [Clostridium sp. FP2]
MNDINKEQIEALEDSLRGHEPVAVSMHMSQKSFEFITSSLRILDKERYRIEQGIEIVSKNSSLFDYQARVIYHNGSSKVIPLREER